MKNFLPTLAVLVALPAFAHAAGMDDANQCAEGSNMSACFDGSPSRSGAEVFGGHASGQAGSGLSRAQQGDYRADLGCAAPAPHHHFAFLKKPKTLLGLAAAGGGAYFGFTHVAAFAGLGGPWGAAALGAAGGLLLGMFLIPKLLHLFHHKKS